MWQTVAHFVVIYWMLISLGSVIIGIGMWKFSAFVAFGFAIALLGFFEFLDMSGRLDILEKKYPKLWGVANRRPARLFLLVMCAGLLAKDVAEATHVPDPPIVKLQPPVISASSSQAVSGGREPKDSLRRRTMRVADELYKYLQNRSEVHPPVAYPDSNDPNPSEERKKAIRICQQYDQETQDYYLKHFRDRMVGIVKEYEAKGVHTRFLENDFKQRVPGVQAVGSEWEGSSFDELSQFRDLAYHVDARDHLIVF